MSREEPEPLARELNLGQATSLVVGIVIGSGIFVAAHRVAQGVESIVGLFAVWVGAGLLTLLGALTYAEFGAMFPRSGGDYVYAGQGLGRFWGFFNGWVGFSLNYPASLGALSLAWAMQLEQLKPAGHATLVAPGVAVKVTALLILALFVVVNYFGVRQGGWTQFGITAAKVALILGLVGAGLYVGLVRGADLAPEPPPTTIGFSLALVGALFAYDGWTGVTRVAGEVKEPRRNVPRALIFGMLAVVAVYVLLTLTYLLVLGLPGMREEATASRTAGAIFGAPGTTFVTVLILVSILGPINGLTLAGPRVYFAMARDGLFPALFARVHARHRVPHWSILVQSGLSALLALLFTRDQLFSYVVLASWVSYALTGVGLLRLRRLDPDRPRPYKVPGYPYVPILFVVLSGGLVLYLFIDAWTDRNRFFGLPQNFLYLVGSLAVMALSWPLFRLFSRRNADATTPTPT